MLVKTHKTKQIINFVDEMGVVDSTHVANIFFNHHKQSLRYAQSKLAQLYKYKLVKRKKTFLGTRYIYYYDTFPIQFEHKYLTTELYTRLCNVYGSENCTCKTEFTEVEGIRPDAYITIKQGKYLYMFFVEIHISNNNFNYQKYLDTYHKRKHIRLTQDGSLFPTILVVTDFKINNDPVLDFVKIDTEFENLDKVMRGII